MEKADKFNETLEDMKKVQLEMKHTLTEIKNIIQRPSSRLEERKNQVKDLEYKEAKDTPPEKQEEKRFQKVEDSVRSLWDNFKRTNIQIFGVPEEEREQDAENLFEEIMTENFPTWGHVQNMVGIGCGGIVEQGQLEQQLPLAPADDISLTCTRYWRWPQSLHAFSGCEWSWRCQCVGVAAEAGVGLPADREPVATLSWTPATALAYHGSQLLLCSWWLLHLRGLLQIQDYKCTSYKKSCSSCCPMDFANERSCRHVPPAAMDGGAELLQLPDKRNKQRYSTQSNN
ncbi:hypothetical protein QTO34_000833 [Cnephaeus nilssonii]|uniref:Uncharacterized protein n=1 Tax=Cnephaeus nilssonii TaxID=3371016 RepID=A0AA40ICB2_CNENI|nr:hypothetical protein QTO34_000833 [Eptesicus nilssonii]